MIALDYELSPDWNRRTTEGELRSADEMTLPVIERGSSLGGLRAMVDDGTLSNAAIRAPAQRVLAAVKQ